MPLTLIPAHFKAVDSHEIFGSSRLGRSLSSSPDFTDQAAVRRQRSFQIMIKGIGMIRHSEKVQPHHIGGISIGLRHRPGTVGIRSMGMELAEEQFPFAGIRSGRCARRILRIRFRSLGGSFRSGFRLLFRQNIEPKLRKFTFASRKTKHLMGRIPSQYPVTLQIGQADHSFAMLRHFPSVGRCVQGQYIHARIHTQPPFFCFKCPASVVLLLRSPDGCRFQLSREEFLTFQTLGFRFGRKGKVHIFRCQYHPVPGFQGHFLRPHHLGQQKNKHRKYQKYPLFHSQFSHFSLSSLSKLS